MEMMEDVPEDRLAFHTAALTKLTRLGLHLAERVVEAEKAPAAEPPAASAEAPPPSPQNLPLPVIERAFSRLSAGIRANIDLERKLTLLWMKLAQQNPAEAPEPAGIPNYLQNDPAFDDNDLARLGRNWKATKASGQSPFQPPPAGK